MYESGEKRVTTDRPIYNRRTGTIAIPQLLIGMVACWPFIWNTWNSFRITSSIGGTWAPLALLWALTFAMLLSVRRIRAGNLSVWFLFIFASCFSIHRALMTDLVKDLSVVLCGVLIILVIPYMKWDVNRVLKIFYTIGLIVALCLIIDNITGLFRTTLIGLYTDTVREHKLRSTTGGGIFSNPAMAGCYIVSGMAAYITHLRKKTGKRSVIEWSVIIIYVVSFLLIRKRGFFIAAFLAIMIIWIKKSLNNRDKTISLTKIVTRAAMVIGILLICFIAYIRISFIKGIVDNFIGKFFREDDYSSGRIDLYMLALRLFNENPIIGIGWGRYRAYTQGIFHSFSRTTFDTHNVYLQLLCETGIVGLLFFVISLVATLKTSNFNVFKLAGINTNQESKFNYLFGLFLQYFFVIYCLSGNPLYDYHFLITFFLGVAICLKSITEQKAICH